MSKGPNGEKRPADVVACAVMIGQMATSEITDPRSEGNAISGHVGTQASAKKLLSERRTELAKSAANARWKNDA